MLLGIGTDIVEIARIARAVEKDAFLTRVYTKSERTYCMGRGKQGMISSFAVRFAAKEAVSKAFGTGLRFGTLRDVEVINDELGAPKVFLHGYFKDLAALQGVKTVHITLSHAIDYAVAYCVLEGE
ncbi:holo-ACP synthase [Selenomonas sp. TAMA-11512]|uniref:holo-ACP synthase n=1 Tax=Selenomonas sp. TAMA-11512 TaxID=3095337 RepID=UPI003085DD29|nr:holo-ACP synthase [Selenomonas sp. TAMA-11512]